MATEIRVPTLGESVSEATIGKWFKKAGDSVAADEPLVEHRRRNARGWQLSHHTEGRVELDALGVGLELEDVYDDLAIVGGGS